MDIKNGDIVTVRMKVNDTSPMAGDFVICHSMARIHYAKIPRADIVSVESRPRVISVGDHVRSPLLSRGALVLARHADYVWVKWTDNGALSTQAVSDFGGV